MTDTISALEILLGAEGEPERCGVVTLKGDIIELENCFSNPLEGFCFAPKDTIKWLSSEKAAATWHTHPGADPNLSEEDYAGFLQWPDVKHYIIGRRDNKPHVLSYSVVDGLLITV